MSKRIAQTRVRDVMCKDVVTVTEGMSIKELKEVFDRMDFNAFPVVRGEKVVGIVTKLDLMRAFSTGTSVSMSRIYDLWAKKVEDVMRTALVSVRPDDTVELVVDYMVEFKLRSLPVIQGGRLVGIVSRTDVLPYLIENGD